ncbi:unnamed protein product [Closterium sp. NIES-65]|nr:unnamed protein product [Closterium sp. NIES-65]
MAAQCARSALQAGRCARSALQAAQCARSALQAGRCARSALQAGRCARSALQAGRCARSALQAGRCARSVLQAGRCARSALQAGRCACSALQAGQCACSALQAGRYARSALQAARCARSALQAAQCARSALQAGRCARSALQAAQCARSALHVAQCARSALQARRVASFLIPALFCRTYDRGAAAPPLSQSRMATWRGRWATARRGERHERWLRSAGLGLDVGRALISAPLRSPLLPCAHLCSPALTSAPLRSPLLPCAHLCSPALTSAPSALTSAPLHSPLLPCTHLYCSPTFHTTVSPSPTVHAIVSPSPTVHAIVSPSPNVHTTVSPSPVVHTTVFFPTVHPPFVPSVPSVHPSAIPRLLAMLPALTCYAPSPPPTHSLPETSSQHSSLLPCAHLCSPALTSAPLRSPLLPCAHLCSPALTSAPLRSPLLPCAHLCSPALISSSTCAHLCSPAVTSAPLRSPLLPCAHLCSPALTSAPCAHLCSPALTSAPLHSPLLPCTHLCSPALTSAPLHSTFHTHHRFPPRPPLFMPLFPRPPLFTPLFPRPEMFTPLFLRPPLFTPRFFPTVHPPFVPSVPSVHPSAIPACSPCSPHSLAMLPPPTHSLPKTASQVWEREVEHVSGGELQRFAVGVVGGQLGDRHLHVWEREVEHLSGGELQRFAIGVVAGQLGDIYMFDEPSSYLDVRQRLKAAQVIRSLLRPDRYVIVVERDLSVLDYLSHFMCCLYGKPGAYRAVFLRYHPMHPLPCPLTPHSIIPIPPRYVIVVEHDLSVLDYLSDFICCLYGKPVPTVVTLPFSVREGINIFLAGFVPTENLRFRDESLTFRGTKTLVDNPEEGGQDVQSVRYRYLGMIKKHGGFNLLLPLPHSILSPPFIPSQVAETPVDNPEEAKTYTRWLKPRWIILKKPRRTRATIDNPEEAKTYTRYKYPRMVKKQGGFKLTVEPGDFTDSQIVVMLGETAPARPPLSACCLHVSLALSPPCPFHDPSSIPPLSLPGGSLKAGPR